ncbi:hypothetical protein [Nonomuraea sp. NPDC049750]|uniref:hypothetical protein n=1 Tax=Nonomuraea sp. NPDC049750 TaxID=3154738 RepID=UPI0033D2C9A0
MISRLPRVIYRPLPDGQDWIIRITGKSPVLVINEALDADGRRQARRAAYAALRGGYPAWVPLPVLAAFGWLADKARSPLGSAVTASALTAVAVYAVTAPHGIGPPPTAGPVIVTIQPTPRPTPKAASPHPSPRRANHTRPPATPSGGHSSPARSTSSPPRRSDGPATPRASRTTSPPATVEAVQEAAVELTPAPSRATADQADAPADLPSTDATLEQAASACGGLGLQVDVDRLLNVDACLLG